MLTNPASVFRQPISARPMTAAMLAAAVLAVAVGIGLMTIDPFERAAVVEAVIETIRPQPTPPPTFSGEELYERLAPSVVTLYAEDENGDRTFSGSGFFLDASYLADEYPLVTSRRDRAKFHPEGDGPVEGAYVLTNYHVIRPAVTADVVLNNGARGEVGEVLAEDEELDLALLSVHFTTPQTVRGIPLAARDPRVMTSVYAIGSPEQLSGTMSEGRVSAYRTLEIGGHWLQTTAPVSHGSSGCPLLIGDGNVAGVITLKHEEGERLNFAVPASVVRQFLLFARPSSRDVAQGASIRWYEEQALRQVADSIQSHGEDTPKRIALEQLDKACREFAAASAAEDGEALAHYREAIRLADQIDGALPDSFAYLGAYIGGKAYLRLAAGQAVDDASFYPTHDSILRFRSSVDAPKALAFLQVAAVLQSDFPPVQEALVEYHARSGHWAAALLASNELVQMMPRSAAALAWRAACYDQLHEPESARDDLEAAVDLSPFDGRLGYQLGNALSALGEHDDAIEAYETALDDADSGLRDALHFGLGIAHRKTGRVDKALAAFATAKALGWPAEACDQEMVECQRLGRGSTVEPDQLTTLVYVTKNGKKYHREGCQYLSKSAIAMPLSEAAGTHEPCSRCVTRLRN